MKLTKSKLKEIIREELLSESQDIDKMASKMKSKAEQYALDIMQYTSLDGDVWGGQDNWRKKYEAMQKLMIQLDKDLDKFGKSWVAKYRKAVDRIEKS
jgi:uncharacterized protein Yka (UPF0111/DUF47 family)